MERTVQSMLLTMPFRRPRQGTDPTPRIVIQSSAISPPTAHTLGVTISRPRTISPCEGIVLTIRRFAWFRHLGQISDARHEENPSKTRLGPLAAFLVLESTHERRGPD